MTEVTLVKQLPPLENRLFKIVPRSSLGKYPGIAGWQILSAAIRNNSHMAQ